MGTIKKEAEGAEKNIDAYDVLELLSVALEDKQMYFKQDNGQVYSRYSGDYLSIGEAVEEFEKMIRLICW